MFMLTHLVFNVHFGKLWYQGLNSSEKLHKQELLFSLLLKQHVCKAT